MKRPEGDPIWLQICRDPFAFISVSAGVFGMVWHFTSLATWVLP